MKNLFRKKWFQCALPIMLMALVAHAVCTRRLVLIGLVFGLGGVIGIYRFIMAMLTGQVAHGKSVYDRITTPIEYWTEAARLAIMGSMFLVFAVGLVLLDIFDPLDP